MEFLRLENLDFQTPGSLTERWGSTQYFGNSLTGRVDGLYEFTQTSGSSYLYAAAGGTFGIAFDNGFSAIYSVSDLGISWGVASSTTYGFWTLSINPIDFDTLQNQVFFGNGKDFLKAVGNTVVFFGLPRFLSGSTNAYEAVNVVANGTSVATGFTGYYYYKLAWTNAYGMQGAPTLATNGGNNGYLFSRVGTAGASSITVSFRGATSGYLLVPPNFDISGAAIFRSGPTATDLTSGLTAYSIEGPDVIGNTYKLYTTIEAMDYSLVGTVGVSSGSVAATFLDGSVTPGLTLLNKNVLPFDWYPIGINSSFPSMSRPTGTGVTIIPKFIETHSNRIFIGGMSYAPSTFYFSEESEPEHFEADFAFEVRTQDGQALTAMKEYNGNLMLFKTNSFHQLSTAAFDPANWVLTQVSSEYGCLGNRAVTTYANWCVFLDRKGIIRYNGANIEILSTKVDPIFQRMNLSAASGAVMTYDKQRNEILCDIPVDGSTMNNLTVVWDIVSNAWGTYVGYKPAVTAIAQGQLSNKQVFYGGYSGLVSYFGPSFLTDNGIGFTCVAKSGFFTDLGESVTKVFRRLFLDTAPVGASSFIDVNLYQDFGSSIVVSATMVLNDFQNRIDFGVSGKALSVEFMCGSTVGLALHGFAVQYRFQRNV